MFRNSKNHTPKSPLDAALNGIDILGDISLILTPLRPTADMIEAGCRVAGLTPMQAQLVYEAMVRASVPAFVEDELYPEQCAKAVR